MKLSLRSGLLGGALCAGVVAAAVGIGVAAAGQAVSAQPAVSVMTSFPGLAPATGEPTLPALAGLHPEPGAIVQAGGPFDDRFRLDALAFDGATLSGTVTITSDVSDLLELEVVAGFYGADGSLLGTGRYVHHADGDHAHSGPPSESEAFEVAVPAGLAQQAVAVGVGVPVLVNE
ncbi:hypothetical protein [Glaciibacter sp. 2TAF33]|uniref:hypothetical protein n=1 Tax=Glaciibacter sp. 2TAF33 TaxID=3233015 RepID=UPI003F931D47